MSYRRSLSRFSLLLLFASLFACVQVWAQSGSGDLTGLVTDQSKAVVPNIQVTLTNNATGEVRNTVTSTAGIYNFAQLPIVGTYTLSMAPSGFKKVEVNNIMLSVGTVVSRDIVLQVGSAGETVTVEGGVPLVQTTESQVSQLIDQRVWKSLPLEDRSQNEFINLVAGAVPNDFSNPGNRGASVNGARSGAGNFLLDGYDNNEQGQGGRGVPVGPGGAATTISPDAIQEYRVITNDFAAEYGRAGGFVTDTVLKSGTNQWHGSAFWYNRMQALAANDYFSNAAGIRDKLVRNQEGGSIGGPIWKDKTFFFATYERHDLRASNPVTGTGFTQEFLNFVKTGQFKTFIESGLGAFPGLCNDPNLGQGAPCPGAVNLSGTTGPIFNQLMANEPNAFPIAPVTSGPCSLPGTANPNTDCIGEGVYTGGLTPATSLFYPVHLYGSVTVTDPNFINQNRASIRVDHNFSSRDTVNTEYVIDDNLTGSALDGGDGTFGVPFASPGRSQNAGVTWNHIFSASLLNSAKLDLTRHRLDFPDDSSVTGVPSIFTGDALSGSFGQTSSLPQFFTDNEIQFKDDMSLTKSKHNFKWGMQYIRTRNGSSFQAIRNGLMVPWSVEDLVTDATFSDQLDKLFFGKPTLGSLLETEASVNPQNGQLPNFYRGYRANELSFYGQDDYRIFPRLTLNLGLRWDYFGPPHNFQPNIDSNFYFGTPTAIASTGNPFFPVNSPLAQEVATGAFQVRNHSIWDKDLNNFGPRVGFAYDVFGSGKLVVRAGYGIAYDRMYNNIYENIRFNPPFFEFALFGAGIGSAPAGALATPGIYGVPFTGTSQYLKFGALPSPRHVDQNLVTAYYQEANFGVQWEFAKNYVLEMNYIGNYGSHLLGIKNINIFDGRTACTSAKKSFSNFAACDAAFLAGEIPSLTFSSKRINTNISSDNFRTSGFSSNYNAGELTVRHTFAGGLQFSSSYTYSKALDALSDAFNARTGSAILSDPQNPRLDYGPADYYLKHRSVTSLYYELPFFKQNKWLGGFSVDGIFSFQSGQPFSVWDSSGTYDPNRDGQTGSDRLDFIGTGNITSAITGHNAANGYFNTALFAPIAAGTATACPASVNFGLFCDANTGRNSLTGPGFNNVDFGVAKKFQIYERLSTTLQAQFFNLFNHTNFHNPHGDLNNSNFGKSTADYGARVTQLSLRFDF